MVYRSLVPRLKNMPKARSSLETAFCDDFTLESAKKILLADVYGSNKKH